jgi:hypothetical protein
MSGGSSSESSSGETTIRYAPYIESRHTAFLGAVASQRSSATSRNPYNGYSEVSVDAGFFGSGYSLSSFPSLYDMYGKFMAGLNIEAIWAELFEDTVNNAQIGTLVAAESSLLRDELNSNILPEFETGMRDIGAVNSSSFVIGKALLEDTRQKMLAKFSAELRYKLLPLVNDRYDIHLKWNSGVIASYMDVIKHYFTIKQSIHEMNYTMLDRGARWPLEMLDYERAALGALQGAMKQTGDAGGPSTGSKVLGGALSGAAAGASFGGPFGAAIGGVMGGLAGLLF